jgi:hypothetical protein
MAAFIMRAGVTSLFSFLTAVTAASAAPLDLGERRELFADRWLIDQFEGTTLRLHPPLPAGVALRMDQPWEGRYSTYVTVLHDGERFRMYYRGRANLPDSRNPVAVDLDLEYQVTCYAESVDGIHWTRPALGLFEVAGTFENNVILARSPACTNFTPFIDARPGVPVAERFKAVGGVHSAGLELFVSADGVHWRSLGIREGLTGAFDTQNIIFWSELEQCYVLYFRTWSSGVAYQGEREVSRSTSPDLVTWSSPERMTYGDAPFEELYTQQTQPYFRAPHLYVAFPNRFLPGRRVLAEGELAAAGIWERSRTSGVNDGVFMTSRGGASYDRTFLEAFVRPGPDRQNWSPRNNYAAHGLLETRPGEISLYYTRHYAQPTNHVERFTLRTDGFASLSAGRGGGSALTKPFTFSGRVLELNYSTAAAGSLAVEVCDEGGRPLPGYALADQAPLVGDEIRRMVSWSGGSDLAALQGLVIRLRLHLIDADLYSLRFAPSEP